MCRKYLTAGKKKLEARVAVTFHCCPASRDPWCCLDEHTEPAPAQPHVTMLHCIYRRSVSVPVPLQYQVNYIRDPDSIWGLLYRWEGSSGSGRIIM